MYVYKIQNIKMGMKPTDTHKYSSNF